MSHDAARQPLHGWGRYPVVDALQVASEDLERASRDAVLSRGLGRAYGDAALPPAGAVRPVSTTVRADRILAFDEETGRIRVEAGLSLSQLMRLYLPRGWFTPVSTGTQYVTVGGMVASDVHGKNHHVHGTFSNFVDALKLRVADGRVLEVSREVEPELFWATCGGMGLTGHILEVTFRLEKLPSPWIYEESFRFDNLREIFEHLEAASRDWPMTVAWIDTSVGGAARGRGILMQGRWATADEAPPHPPPPRPSVPVPFVFPSGLLNRHTIRLANAIWWHKHGRRPKKHIVHPENFFYQLDLATDWNRAYGRRGFTQYQCVMPRSLELYDELLQHFQRLGGCSFVTVFKDCGAAGEGHLSFPQPGTSLAVDIPIGAGTERLVRELNAFVIANGGRVYLAKDAYTTAEEFRRMYPRLDAWQAVRQRWDPDGRLQSAQGVRLGLVEPRTEKARAAG